MFEAIIETMRLAALAISTLLCGCGDNLPPPPPPLACVSATVDVLGGTIVHPDGATLVLPPGAVASTTTITLCDAGPAPGVLAHAFEAAPAELALTRPAQISIPVDPAQLAAVGGVAVELEGVAFQSSEDLMNGVITASVPTLGRFLPLGTSGGLTVSTPLTLPVATVGTAYQLALAASGGTPPYTWTLLPPSALPPGLTLSNGGELSGVPTVSDQFALFVKVTDSAGHAIAAALELAVEPIHAPVPVVELLVPNSLPQGSPATHVMVLGIGFVPRSVVHWDGSPRATSFLDSTHMMASLSAADLSVPGTHQVTVSSPPPGGGLSNAVAFTVIPPNPTPTLTAVLPMVIPVSSVDFQITAKGSSFVTTSSVTVGGQPISTRYVSSTELVAAIPAAYLATAGTLEIAVVNPPPGGGTSNAIAVMVSNANPPATVTQLVPASRPVGSGDFTLEAIGSSFLPGATLVFGHTALATTVLDASHAQATVPGSLIATIGTVDVAVVNPMPGGGSTGSIAFAVTGACTWAGTAITLGTYPSGIATGDFDEDGHLDLIVAGLVANTVDVLLGDGSGGFTAQSSQSAGTAPIDVATADFNHDGHLDAVVSTSCSQAPCAATVLLGDGSGRFTATRTARIGTGTQNVGEIATGDLDGDGNVDLVIANLTDISVLLGDGQGGFTSSATLTIRAGGHVVRGVAVADLDHDGKLDVVATDQGSSGNGIVGVAGVFLGNGHGGFAAAVVLAAGNGTFAVRTGDFDGDGKLDVAVSNNVDATVSVFLGDGTGSFGNAITTPVPGSVVGRLGQIVARDFDGDGHLDLAAVDSGNSITHGFAAFMFGRGDGTFVSTTSVDLGINAIGITSGDFNGDGRFDLAAANQVANTVTIALATCP